MSESLNQDFTKRVVINTLIEEWHTSPSSGVERLYLERDNMGEFAKASSIVKFQPGSEFEEHIHDNGEEIFLPKINIFNRNFCLFFLCNKK